MEERRQVAGFSKGLYRALLVAYPKEFRRQYSEQLVQAFGDLYREELEQHGKTGLPVLWMRALGDLAVSVVSERSGFLMSSPSLVRLGGSAFVLSGILYLIAWWLVFTLFFFGRFTWSEAPTIMPRGPVATDLAAGLVAAGLLALGISILRRTVSSTRWTKILITGGISLAAVAFVASIVEVIIGMIVGATFMMGPWFGLMPDGPEVPPGSLQSVLLDVAEPLAHWTLALTSLALGGVLLFTRAAGWGRMLSSLTGLLLPLASLFHFPEAAGLLAFAIWRIFYEGFNDPSITIPTEVMVAPHALVAFGWVIVGLAMRSRGSEHVEEPIRV